jgi:hypothetical protein
MVLRKLICLEALMRKGKNMLGDASRAGDCKMVHARGYYRHPLRQRGPLRSYFKIVGYDVLLLLMVHSLAYDWLSYLFVVSPELGSTSQT